MEIALEVIANRTGSHNVHKYIRMGAISRAESVFQEQETNIHLVNAIFDALEKQWLLNGDTRPVDAFFQKYWEFGLTRSWAKKNLDVGDVWRYEVRQLAERDANSLDAESIEQLVQYIDVADLGWWNFFLSTRVFKTHAFTSPGAWEELDISNDEWEQLSREDLLDLQGSRIGDDLIRIILRFIVVRYL